MANQSDAAQHIEARLRVAGKNVEVWRPMTGAIDRTAAFSTGARMADRSGNRQPGIEPAAYTEQFGYTVVPLDLAERESVFVVSARCGGFALALCDGGRTRRGWRRSKARGP